MMRCIVRRVFEFSIAFGAFGNVLAQGDEAIFEFRVKPLPNTHQQFDMRADMDLRMERQPRPGLSDTELEEFKANAKSEAARPHMNLSLRTAGQQTVHTGPLDDQGRMAVKSLVVLGPMQKIKLDATEQYMSEQAAQPPMRFTGVFDSNTSRYESAVLGGKTFLIPEAQEKTIRLVAFGAPAALDGVKLRVGESIDLPLHVTLSPPPQSQQAASMDGALRGRYTLLRVQDGIADFDIRVRMDISVMSDAVAPVSTMQVHAEGVLKFEFQQPSVQNSAMQIRADGAGQLRLRFSDRLALRHNVDVRLQTTTTLADGSGVTSDVKLILDEIGRDSEVTSAPQQAATSYK